MVNEMATMGRTNRDLDMEYRKTTTALVEALDEAVNMLEAAAWAAELTGRPDAMATFEAEAKRVRKVVARLIDRFNLQL